MNNTKYDIGSEYIETYDIKTDDIKTDDIVSNYIKSNYITSDHTGLDYVTSEYIESEYIESEYIETDDIETDDIGTDDTKIKIKHYITYYYVIGIITSIIIEKDNECEYFDVEHYKKEKIIIMKKNNCHSKYYSKDTYIINYGNEFENEFEILYFSCFRETIPMYIIHFDYDSGSIKNVYLYSIIEGKKKEFIEFRDSGHVLCIDFKKGHTNDKDMLQFLLKNEINDYKKKSISNQIKNFSFGISCFLYNIDFNCYRSIIKKITSC